MTNCILWLYFTVGYDELLIVDSQVDVAELNHIIVIEFNGVKWTVRECGTYWVFWAWSPSRKRYCVVDWVPSSSASLSGNILTARKQGQMCKIRISAIRETWTLYDRELLAKETDNKDWDRPLINRYRNGSRKSREPF